MSDPPPTEIPVAIPDVNVLVALVREGHQHHREASAWFDTVVRYATTPITEAGLLRLVLNTKVMGQVTTPPEAIAALRHLTADPRARFLADDVSFTDPKN